MKNIQYWLLKTEPETYSFEQLIKDGKTNWNGVRNFQARNFLREMKPKDLALIYHSGDEKAVVGVAEITSLPYEEIDKKKKGEWVQVDLKSVKPFSNRVPLAVLKAHPKLQQLRLIKQSRLSVMPVTEKEFELILSLDTFDGS